MYTRESLLSKPYTWGKLVEIHEIGNYLIVEYKETKLSHGDFGSRLDGKYEDESSFHPYVNGSDTNSGFDTLDRAIIHAVACNAGHSRASEHIINMLRPLKD